MIGRYLQGMAKRTGTTRTTTTTGDPDWVLDDWHAVIVGSASCNVREGYDAAFRSARRTEFRRVDPQLDGRPSLRIDHGSFTRVVVVDPDQVQFYGELTDDLIEADQAITGAVSMCATSVPIGRRIYVRPFMESDLMALWNDPEVTVPGPLAELRVWCEVQTLEAPSLYALVDDVADEIVAIVFEGMSGVWVREPGRWILWDDAPDDVRRPGLRWIETTTETFWDVELAAGAVHPMLPSDPEAPAEALGSVEDPDLLRRIHEAATVMQPGDSVLLFIQGGGLFQLDLPDAQLDAQLAAYYEELERMRNEDGNE